MTGDSRADFLTSIGFTMKKEVEALASGSFHVPVSDERLDLLEADLTVVFPIGADVTALKNHPLLTKKALVLEDKDLINAFSSGSSLGTAYALDKGVPLFQTAVG